MPLYEYECTACHRRTEKIQKFSDAPLTVCPHCGGALEKLLHAPAVSFKGGGWYADGYGNARPKSSGESAPKPAAAGSSAPKPGADTSANASTSAPSTASAPAASGADKK